MLLYKFFNPNPAGKMVRDCVVRAICKAENLSWEFAYLSICAAGLVEYDMPDGNDVWGIYFKNRGYTREYIPNTCPDCYTVEAFCKDHPKGLYVLCTGNHAVCVVDGDVQNALCGGFAGVNATVNGAQNAISQQLYTNQMADMNRSFDLQSQLAQCCCDNRAAVADLKYTLATEECATRNNASNGYRDIITNQNANTQKILDQMCQDKIDAKNETIAQLRQELMFARGQASQDVQTAAIQAGQRNLANEIEQYVLPTPRPAYVVANPNCCNNGYGFNGCGCGA